jgi:RNA-directed DNA polymerase
LSPLLANIALSVLDEHFQRKWDAFSIGTRFPGQRRQRLRRAGGAVHKIVRYADDFVVLVSGQRHHAEQLWDEVAAVLAPIGLSLSVEKTRVVHIDEGIDFLGWRIQRRRKAGTLTKKVVYTYPSKRSLNRIVGKVRVITRRSGSPYESLEQLLKHLNAVVRGWCNYFRHGVSAATYRYLYLYMWTSVVRWLRARHPKLGWHKIQRRFLTGYPAHRPEENGIVLYNPQEIQIKRYRWRGYTIPTPWTSLATRLDAAQQA